MGLGLFGKREGRLYLWRFCDNSFDLDDKGWEVGFLFHIGYIYLSCQTHNNCGQKLFRKNQKALRLAFVHVLLRKKKAIETEENSDERFNKSWSFSSQ